MTVRCEISTIVEIVEKNIFWRKGLSFGSIFLKKIFFPGETVVDTEASASSPPPFSPAAPATELTHQLSPPSDASVQISNQPPDSAAANNNSNSMEMDVTMGMASIVSPASNYGNTVEPPTSQNNNGNDTNIYMFKSHASIGNRQISTKDTNQNFVDQNVVEMYRNGNMGSFRQDVMNGIGAYNSSDPMMNASVSVPQSYRKFVRSIHDQMIQNGDAFKMEKMELKDEPENGF